MTMNKIPESTSIMVVDDTSANLKLLQEISGKHRSSLSRRVIAAPDWACLL